MQFHVARKPIKILKLKKIIKLRSINMDSDFRKDCALPFLALVIDAMSGFKILTNTVSKL